MSSEMTANAAPTVSPQPNVAETDTCVPGSVLAVFPLQGRSESARGMNQLYARAALRDALLRGEAPIAPHMLYDQLYVLDSSIAGEAETGRRAATSLLRIVDRVVVYIDRGMSEEMLETALHADALGLMVENRSLPEWSRA